VRHLSVVSQFEVRQESTVNAVYASEWEAEDHDPNHVLCSASVGIAAWASTIVAGGGGLLLLGTKGPWPLTNGWFALLSGVSGRQRVGF